MGVLSSLNGAKFADGFISAGFAKGVGTHLNDEMGNQIVAGTIVSAAIGGTTSSIVGGKFANGAVTVAMQVLFNLYSSEENKPSKNANDWEHETTILGTGITVDVYAGRYLKIELDSVTLGMDGTYVQVTAFPLDLEGNELPTIRRNGPDSVFASHAGIGYRPSRVFDAGYENNHGFKWVIKVPAHQSPHGNASGIAVKVYKWGGK